MACHLVISVANLVDTVQEETTVKKEKTISETKRERPRRAIVSEKDALKQMKDFSKRKEQFLATARTGKGRSVRS